MLTNEKPLLIAKMAAQIAAGMVSDHENYQADIAADSVTTAGLIFEEVERVHGFIFEQEDPK